MLKTKLKLAFLGLTIFCCLNINSVVEADSIERVAVLPFRNISEDKQFEWLSQGFSESLTSAFAQVGKFSVIERSQINQIIKEQTFQQSNFVDNKSVVELFKILGVDKLVIGSYQIYQGNININSRVIDVKTGEVVKGSSITNKRDRLENIFNLQEEIGILHTKNLNVENFLPEKIKITTTPITKSLSIYEYYLKGRDEFFLLNPKGFSKAIEYYNKALQIDDKYAPAYSELAQTYSKWGYQRMQNGLEFKSYFQKALDYGNKAISISPNISDSHRGLGVAYLKSGNKVAAERELRKAVEINPLDNESYLFLWHTISPDVNHPYLKRSLEINPDFPVAYNIIGETYMRNKNFDKAIENFEYSIKLNPYFSYAMTNLGNLYMEKKDYDNAIRIYEKAVKIDPDFVYAYICLGNAYLSKNNYAKAIEFYEDAIKVNDHSVYAYNNLGGTYHRIGDFGKAINNYQKAIEFNPEFPDPYLNLGLSYESIKDKNKAKLVYQNFLAKFPDSPKVAYVKSLINSLN